MSNPPAESVLARICDCDCGCEADGVWHFLEIRCACVSIGCLCVVDRPGYPVPHVDGEA